MRLLLSALVPFLGAVFTSPSTAILVAPSSGCDERCGNALSSTSGSDLVCGDGGYGSISGQTFQNCINCEISSTFVDSNTRQSDLQWLLYNLRYAVSFCLFGYPDNANVVSNPCMTSTACGIFQKAVEYGSLAKNVSQYEYCSVWLSGKLQKCQTCLAQLRNEFYLSNFLTALEAGCKQQPAPGSTLSLDGSLFSSTAIIITTPVNSTVPTYTPQPAGPLSLSEGAGIAGGGVVFLLTVLGCCIIWRGKRQRRAYLAQFATSHRQPMAHRPFHDMTENSPESESGRAFMAPDSARWQGWSDDSPQSAAGEKGGMKAMGMPIGGFSPYHSQYSSPISPDAAQWHAGGSDSGAKAKASAMTAKGKGKEVVRETDAARGSVEGEGEAIEMSQMAPGQQMGFSPMSMAMSTQTAPIIKPPIPTHVLESPDSAASRNRSQDEADTHAEAEHQTTAEGGAVDGLGVAL